MNKSYYVGLDMGTSSCGWAVTDENYQLIRAKGKDLWGVRLFSEAETAAKRRTFRVARRRRAREKARIGYLREFFADEINKVDPGFYQRLDDSKYHIEDKTIYQSFSLFADEGFTDKDYYEQYPTIFHLRKELIESEEWHDIRLIYLAILNMFKHRGHFLNANLNDNESGDFGELYCILKNAVKENLDLELPEISDITKLEDILSSKEFSNSKKVEEVISMLGLNKSKQKIETEIIKLICGLKGTISKIFVNQNYDEDGKKLSISFRDGNFEEKCEQVEAVLSEESFEMFLIIKQMHDWAVLANIMKGKSKTYDYLSFARVDAYDKHKKDLTILKHVFKKYIPEQYDSMFRTMEKDNYSAYVGSVNSGKEVIRRCAKTKIEDFYKKIQKIVKNLPQDKETAYILNEIEKGTFLPKQLTASNGVIPNQVHKRELKKILQNAEKYYDFLKMEDERGLSVSDKIIQLFEFQIPYYIGPLLNLNGKGNGWAVRKETGAVMPWNFDEKINVKASAEKFISKMVNHCTYLNNETVLPKNSLLYEKYTVLNELNNLKLNGVNISVDLKQKIYNELFKKGKKVTGKKLKNYLLINGVIDKQDEVEISGIDGDFTNTLANYKKFMEIFEVDVLTHEQEQIAEKIIFWSTVYGDSKSFLREKIEEEYGDMLTKNQLKRILGFKFKDWGRFSKAFLELEGADKNTGEIQTIISRMWNENYNIMELLSNQFTYLEKIKDKTNKIEKTLTEIAYEDLDELYISAPVKRMTWQTILLLKEIYQVMGTEPKRIFIEMAREADEVKKRTISRKNKFAALYKNCKEEGRNWAKEIADTDESKFRSKKLYLYYTQKGRCMYTGDIIEFSDLFNDNLYDIDHIYPRHFVKDDSIENNLVLVKKETNSHKSDSFPIEGGIRKRQYSWWKSLEENGFITKEKFERLTRNTEFSNEELANFVSRQIVETRQGTKVIADLFNQTFPESEIVYAKASNVSAFRRHFDFIKCRSINDFHHAQDAYLNIVVGNTYYIKFTKNPYNFITSYKKNPKKNPYHMYKIFDYSVKRGEEVAWKAENGESIAIVRKMMEKNTPLITRMNYEEHGSIADQTIYSANEAKKAKGVGYLPVKARDSRVMDTTKYGGFKKFTGAYFFLVEHTVKKKRVRTLEAMPLYLKDQLDTVEKMEQYCREVLGLLEPNIRLKKIKMYSLIKVDGFYLYLTGRSKAQILVSNAIELVMDYKKAKYIKKLTELSGKNYSLEQLENHKDISKKENLEIYDLLLDKHLNSIYSKRPNPVGEKLNSGRNKFIALDIDKQIYTLLQIVQLSQLSNMGADLTAIGGVKKTGVSTLNKKISDKSEFKLINQSITGLYKNEIDLLTV